MHLKWMQYLDAITTSEILPLEIYFRMILCHNDMDKDQIIQFKQNQTEEKKRKMEVKSS